MREIYKSDSASLPSQSAVFPDIMKLALPAAFESLFLGLVDLADTKMVSDLGITAVAAVGLTSQPKRILLMAILAINVAATTVISQCMGSGDLAAANRSMRKFLLLTLGASTLIYVPGFLFARPILWFCGARSDTIELALTYFRILVVGQFVQALSLTINACQRGSGNTKIAMVTSIAANLINIAGNYLFIYGHLGAPRLGVAGAALAASIGSFVAFGISMYTVVLKKGRILNLCVPSACHGDIPWGTVRPMIFSAFGEQLFQRIGMVLYVQIAANLGTAAFGTYQICMEIANFEGYTFDGFSVAATALVGQSLGGGKPDMASSYAKSAVKLAYGCGLLIGLPTVLFRRQIMELFDQDPQIVQMGANALFIVGISALVSAGAGTYAGALRGAGDTKTVAVWTLWSTLVFRPAAAWVLCKHLHLGLTGVWLAFLMAYTIRCAALGYHVSKGAWKEHRKL